MRRHYTDKQRSDLIGLVTSGQATVSEAAARLGVGPSTGYYWMKGPRAATPERARRSGSKARRLVQTTFVRVVRSTGVQAAMTVRVGAAEIQVRQDFDAALLRALVEALRGEAA